jgi:hypothetical protein
MLDGGPAHEGSGSSTLDDRAPSEVVAFFIFNDEPAGEGRAFFMVSDGPARESGMSIVAIGRSPGRADPFFIVSGGWLRDGTVSFTVKGHPARRSCVSLALTHRRLREGKTPFALDERAAPPGRWLDLRQRASREGARLERAIPPYRSTTDAQ